MIIICCGKLVGINVQLCTQIKVGLCFVLILMSFDMTTFGQECVISVDHMDHFSEIKLCGKRCVWIRISVGQVILLSFDPF